MRNVLWTEDADELYKTHSGCISSIFHVLDYGYWNSSVKKILPHRKHDMLDNRSKRNRRHKRISHDQDPLEALKLLDTEPSHILVDESYTKTSSTLKNSLKTRVKAIFKDDNHKERDPDFVSSPRLQRTYAVNHLETDEWVHPIVFFPENVNSEESPVSAKDPSNITNSEIKDVLEIFKVNKEIFVNILQDDLWFSERKAKLTKSGSFPVAYKSGTRNLKPTKLKHKLNEFYSISRNDKELDNPAPKLSSSNSGSLLDDEPKNDNLIRIRRISSLNESAERYAQFFDFCVVKEAGIERSRSLKLMNGSENSLCAQEPSFSKRIRSLPHLENPIQESCESQNERKPVVLEVCEFLNGMIDKSDTISENERSISPEVSTHLRCSQEEISRSEFQILDGLESLNNPQENLKHYQDADDFTYVKQILDQSGFIKNGSQQKWYSSNQPLDPFVFQEIESQYFHDPDDFAQEFKELSHRLLIFDLVEDILLNIFERSLTYYPKALSSSCHNRLTPTGPHVLDEVWKRVNQLLNLKPDMNQSLDSIVSKDLGTNDWMNLQMDLECVGIELEDLIFDDVLEEVLFECSLIERVVL